MALVPGTAMFLHILPFPLNIEQLLGGLSLAFGAAVVTAVVACKGYIARASNFTVAVLTLLCAVAGAALALGFFDFGNTHIQSFTQSDNTVSSVVVPLRPSGELPDILNQFGGSYLQALASGVYRDRVLALIAEQNRTAVALLATFLLGAQGLLIGAIVIGAWKVADFFTPANGNVGSSEPPQNS